MIKYKKGPHLIDPLSRLFISSRASLTVRILRYEIEKGLRAVHTFPQCFCKTPFHSIFSTSYGEVGVEIMVFQSLSAAATIQKQLLRLKLHITPATNS